MMHKLSADAQAAFDAECREAAEWYRGRSDDVQRLRAENAALRKDAERYRWLRDVADAGEWEEIGHQTTPDTTDSAIDAAMAMGAR